MNSMKAEIEACFRTNLKSGLDVYLVSLEFIRRDNALIYSRKLTEAVQKIEIPVEVHPADRPDSAAAIYPWLSVSIDAVEKIALEMVGSNESLLSDLQGTTLRQPIEFTSAKAAHARWFVFQPDSVPGIVAELKSFLEQWTVPFLDLYSTPAGICSAYDHGDARVLNDLGQKLRVVAGMMLCGRNRDALGVLERWFGKPGLRKHYQPVFDHLDAKTREAS